MVWIGIKKMVLRNTESRLISRNLKKLKKKKTIKHPKEREDKKKMRMSYRCPIAWNHADNAKEFHLRTAA
jgi:hypothetical protein